MIDWPTVLTNFRDIVIVEKHVSIDAFQMCPEDFDQFIDQLAGIPLIDLTDGHAPKAAKLGPFIVTPNHTLEKNGVVAMVEGDVYVRWSVPK